MKYFVGIFKFILITQTLNAQWYIGTGFNNRSAILRSEDRNHNGEVLKPFFMNGLAITIANKEPNDNRIGFNINYNTINYKTDKTITLYKTKDETLYHVTSSEIARNDTLYSKNGRSFNYKDKFNYYSISAIRLWRISKSEVIKKNTHYLGFKVGFSLIVQSKVVKNEFVKNQLYESSGYPSFSAGIHYNYERRISEKWHYFNSIEANLLTKTPNIALSMGMNYFFNQ